MINKELAKRQQMLYKEVGNLYVNKMFGDICVITKVEKSIIDDGVNIYFIYLTSKELTTKKEEFMTDSNRFFYLFGRIWEK